MVSNTVSIRVRDGFGFEFSGSSVNIIRDYFLRTTLQFHSPGALKFTCPDAITDTVLPCISFPSILLFYNYRCSVVNCTYHRTLRSVRHYGNIKESKYSYMNI